MARGSRKFTRSTKTAILFVGEGSTDKAFLQHLQSLYVSRDAEIVVKVESGSGGDPTCVVQKGVRLRSNRDYDRCFVLIDSDRPLVMDGKLQSRVKKRPSITIQRSTPCIEGLLLAILGHANFSQLSASPDECKREFETNYMRSDRKTDKRSYAARFTKELLDERRKDISELDAILRAMGA